MHIHLPKPLHGWREFVGEVAIIVLGVLIALGLEQVVENYRERRLAREAQETIRAEIADALGTLENRMRIEGCIHRRLGELATFVDQATSGTASEAPRWIGRPQVWQMDASRWDAASQSGRISLFTNDDQAEFSQIYGSLKAVQDSENAEQIIWAQLRSMEGQSRLSETAASQMRAALAQARLTDWRIRVAFGQAKERAEKLGIRWTTEVRGSLSVCIPIGTSRPEALTRINSPYGEP